jgi:hypothetical protein
MESPLANRLLGLEPFVAEFHSVLALSCLSDFFGSVQVQGGRLQRCADLRFLCITMKSCASATDRGN